MSYPLFFSSRNSSNRPINPVLPVCLEKQTPAPGDFRILFTLPGSTLFWKYTNQEDRDNDYTDILLLRNSGAGDLSLTTVGSSGPATLVGGTLNIPQYSGGSGISRYVHTQAVAATVWNVAHGLNSYPPVSVINSANDEVMGGQVHYTDANNLTITFSYAFSGKAIM